MIYDYNHYNDPKKGNKHIYAYGESYSSMEYCGFIHADTKRQAQTVLNAHNRKWDDYGCVLLDYTEEQCKAEIERRAKKRKGWNSYVYSNNTTRKNDGLQGFKAGRN